MFNVCHLMATCDAVVRPTELIAAMKMRLWSSSAFLSGVAASLVT